MLSRRKIFGLFGAAAATTAVAKAAAAPLEPDADGVLLRSADGRPVLKMVEGQMIMDCDVVVTGNLGSSGVSIGKQIAAKVQDMKARRLI